ncbi:DUF2971 domain-containing protein [Burkholderia multivorans]|uniref:DUF2971 domain-containing protein n=1 Tax=Burkholderia multivorans TaxID=87883 RepID=UPI0028673BFB|nr:DUF2971 domain-containing protein [Burkholderia multivorans]MDR8763971.1 hypothetical protein [Burkholderia multivorans]MDR8769625.1 hypothetical protein [Burkholderia multivorans]MDR8775315.1 hypothetical protein [Burkholderia multivorans]MDR8793631.1 hypothetical protein [Burkholderia multivorans]MDR8846986.1 hypothetical protein [Burkholderia multivorans]
MLYHYQSFNDRTADRLERTLRDRIIHMSQPSTFNDPWDCRPWFDISILDDPNEREQHLQWLMRTANVQPEDEQELRTNALLMEATIAQIRDGQPRAIDDQYRLYCLLPDPMHPLMWAHYGDSHRGIALEFDTSADQIMWAYRVYYRSEYPTIRMYEDDNNANLVPIFTKSDVWAYENEYRMIAEERQQPRMNMLATQGSSLRLARGALVGVVLGCQCDEDRALALLDQYGRDLRVRRAKRRMDRYSLTLETIW